MNDPINARRRSLMLVGAAALATPSVVPTPTSAVSRFPQGEGPQARQTTLIDAETRAGLAAISPLLLDLVNRSAFVPSDLDAGQVALVELASVVGGGVASRLVAARTRAALIAGVAPGEIVEVAVQAVVYAGFPAAQAAMQTARAVFEAEGVAWTPGSQRPDGDDRTLGRETPSRLGAGRLPSGSTRIDPDIEALLTAFGYGEIFNRSGLSLPDRTLVALIASVAAEADGIDVGALASGCLRLGWSREALIDGLALLASDHGWAGIAALAVPLTEGFAASVASAAAPRAVDTGANPDGDTDRDRQARGEATMARVSQASGQSVVSSFEDIAPDLGRYILEFAYGDVFSRPGLDDKSRELATVSALTASGRPVDRAPLAVHINGALNVGASPREIMEAVIHMIPYIGFSKVQAAGQIAYGVFEERNLALAPARTGAALTIIGRLQARPGQGRALEAALLPVVAASRREPGCINYDLHRDETDPDVFVIYENWADQTALDRHFEEPHSVALAERLPALLATPLTMERLQEVSRWIGRKSV